MKRTENLRRALAVCAVWVFSSRVLLASPSTSIFSNQTTPAHELNDLSIFVLCITLGIWLTVAGLLTYALVRYRARPGDNTEPPQVFGSVQIELSWTIIPILIIVVLFLATARVLFSVQDARKPPTALDVTVIGHQFWWEFRYPQYNVVTANELHIPVSTKSAPRPTFMKLTSADVMHSFWVPQLDGKTDVLPNRVNEMWVDPHTPGLYVGQCAQFCGPQHAHMLLRVYVDTPEQFKEWIAAQQKPQPELSNFTTQPKVMPNMGSAGPQKTALEQKIPANSPANRGGVTEGDISSSTSADARTGQRVFEEQSCISCHTITGTVATGRYGPDLTHLMSRDTIASGAVKNDPKHLLEWIGDPNQIKPGCLMPAMHLTDKQNEQITAYLLTLK